MDARRNLRADYAQLASDMNVTMPKEQAMDSSCFATLASSALASTRQLAASLQAELSRTLDTRMPRLRGRVGGEDDGTAPPVSPAGRGCLHAQPASAAGSPRCSGSPPDQAQGPRLT
ncbi:MAG: hypothetical protein WDW38_004668 [Sanguina aurantia]